MTTVIIFSARAGCSVASLWPKRIENLAALAVKLTPADLRAITSAASKIAVQEARYPEALEQRTDL